MLNKTLITNHSFDCFVQLQNLTHLSVESTKIAGNSILRMKRHENLKAIHLHGTKVESVYRRQLKEYLPDVAFWSIAFDEK